VREAYDNVRPGSSGKIADYIQYLARGFSNRQVLNSLRVGHHRSESIIRIAHCRRKCRTISPETALGWEAIVLRFPLSPVAGN
jgi:hypothetical protein